MFQLDIKTDNAAFEAPRDEIARILRAVATALDHGNGDIISVPIMDVNGNRVGRWTLLTDN